MKSLTLWFEEVSFATGSIKRSQTYSAPATKGMDGCFERSSKFTTHCCKCTCLSYLAKRWVSFEGRLCLGYHSSVLKMALTYSRDGASRPLALLQQAFAEICTGKYEPDNARRGRLHVDSSALNSGALTSEN